MQKGSLYRAVQLSLLLLLVSIQPSDASSLANSNTTTTTDICHSQNDGTFLPVQDNCALFVYCLDQQTIIMQCPKGQSFSDMLGYCVQSNCNDNGSQVILNASVRSCLDNEQRPENQAACKGQPFGALVSYPGNCSKFLVCNCVYPTVKECCCGLYFDNTISVCNYPQAVDCQNGGGSVTSTPGGPATTTTGGSTMPSTTTTVVSTKTEEILTTTTPATPSTTLPTTTTPLETTSQTSTTITLPTTTPMQPCHPLPAIEPNVCQQQTPETMLPYPYNCSAYILCESANCARLEYCPADKIFNPYLSICDTPDTVPCTEIPFPTTTTTTLPTTSDITPTTTTTTGSTTTEKDITPATTTTDGTTTEKDINTPMTSTSTTTVATTVATTQLPPNVNPLICQNMPDGLMPFAPDCSKYLQCLNGEVSLESCPTGWLFNAQWLMCDQASEEVCFTDTTTTTPMTTSTTTTSMTSTTTTESSISTTTGLPIYEKCMGAEVGTTFPYSKDCQKYIYCQDNGTYSLFSCPNQNFYNPLTGDCGPEVSPTACQDIVSTTTLATTTTQNTPQTPDEKCSGQGLGSTFPYEEDCGKYVYCTGSAGVILPCPPNNYYDPARQNCGPNVEPNACQSIATTTPITATTTSTQSPPKTPEEKCADQPLGSSFPYEQDCAKYIYCTGQAGVVMPCPPNNYYDPVTHNCGPNVQPNACQSIATTTIAPTTTTTQSTAQTPDEKCAGKPLGSSFPYEEDCARYVLCSGDAGVIVPCPNDNYYNPLTGDCGPQVSPTACQSTIASTTTTIATTTTQSAPQTPDEKCLDQPLGSVFPYEEDCTKYVYCTGVVGVIFPCPPNSYYDPAMQNCGPNVQPNACRNIATTTTSTTTIATTTTQSPTKTPDEKCANQPMGSSFPYEQDCAKYVYCTGELGLVMPCPPNSYYDPATQNCGPNVQPNACQNIATTTVAPTTTTTQSGPQTPEEKCEDQPPGSSFPYEEDCAKYIYCNSTGGIILPCPYDNYYNPLTGDCGPELKNTACQLHIVSTTALPTTTTQSIPQTPDEKCADQPLGSSLPYEENCAKYIYCTGNGGIVMPCTPNSYYDPATQSCSLNTQPNTCQPGFKPDSTTPVLPTTTTSTTSTFWTTAMPSNGICGSYTAGELIIYPDNCQKYIACVKPAPIALTCNYNYYFNADQQQCVAGLCEGMEAVVPPATDICQGASAEDVQVFPKDCQLYYQCLGSNGFMLKACSQAEYFNPLSGQCSADVSSDYCQQDFSTTTSTEKSTTTITTTTTITSTIPTTAQPSGDICFNIPEDGKVAYPANCSKYIVCQAPIPVAYDCENDLQFSTSKQLCVSPCDSDCAGGTSATK